MKLVKCDFGRSHVHYLGHIVSGEGIEVDPAKVKAVKDMPAPTSVKQLQVFLGLCNYYGKYIPSFATHAKPFYKLLKKNTTYIWGDACIHAFDTLKRLLCSAPCLVMPDFSSPFVVHCDASGGGVGAVLTQHDKDGCERPIMYVSHKMNDAETRYSTTHQELLAVIYALKKFKPYLYGQQFSIYTDHQRPFRSRRCIARCYQPAG